MIELKMGMALPYDQDRFKREDVPKQPHTRSEFGKLEAG